MGSSCLTPSAQLYSNRNKHNNILPYLHSNIRKLEENQAIKEGLLIIPENPNKSLQKLSVSVNVPISTSDKKTQVTKHEGILI